jgi:diguanylate cyclase (GGDEF)-like protein
MVGGGNRAAAIAFSVVLGLLGWAYLIAAPWLPALAVHPSPRSDLLPLLIFAAVILGIRAMAVRMLQHLVLSLDSAFYVGASLCLGALAAGRMVAIALTVDALVRFLVARRRRDAEAADGVMSVAYVLFFGGVSGAVLLAWSHVFAVDDVMTDRPSQGAIALEFVLVALGLMVTHYALQALRSVLRGRALGEYLRQVALPGMLAELVVVPMGIVIVFIYQPQALLGFVFVCLTYLALHYAFSRLRRTTLTLAQRVTDLERLNHSARQLASSIELETVIDAVATELPRAVAVADWVALVHRGHERTLDGYVVDRFECGPGEFVREPLAAGAGLAARVIEQQRTVLIDDLSAAPRGGDDVCAPAGARAWLAAPVFVDNRCEGALVVASRRPGAFEDDHRRVVEGVALQVGAAIQNAHLYEMAMVDGLTGLFVRRYFDARIAEELERARRYGAPFSVVMMDIDDFKRLNDTHGHLAGDRVLREVATIVRDQMRGVDTAARYGGEEFAVVLPRTEKVAAYNLAERIRAAIAERTVALDGGPTISVTASLGIAAYPDGDQPDDGNDGVVRRADLALYRAKQLGKNRVELYWSDGAAPTRPATGSTRLRRPSSSALTPPTGASKDEP